MTESCDLLVLGIGNPLWGDEGFGLAALAALERDWELPRGVETLDGGTQGMYLLPHIRAARRLLVLVAIDFSQPPGTILVLRDDEVPRLMGARRLSLHQTSFQDVLAAAELLGGVPQDMRLVGVQCRTLEDFGGPMSPEITAALPAAVERAAGELAAMGFPPRRR